MAPNILTPVTSKAFNQPASTPAAQVGLTWAGAGLNIDLDNIMGGKSNKTGPAPSMNQLASNSPQHHAKPMGKSSISFSIFRNLIILVFYNLLFIIIFHFCIIVKNCKLKLYSNLRHKKVQLLKLILFKTSIILLNKYI